MSLPGSTDIAYSNPQCVTVNYANLNISEYKNTYSHRQGEYKLFPRRVELTRCYTNYIHKDDRSELHGTNPKTYRANFQFTLENLSSI